RVHESRNRRPATIRRAKPPRIRHRPRRHARLGAPQYRCAPPGTAAQLDRVDVGALDVARTLLSVRTDKSVGATLLLQLEIDRLRLPRLDAFSVLRRRAELRGLHRADRSIVEAEARITAQDLDVNHVAGL